MALKTVSLFPGTAPYSQQQWSKNGKLKSNICFRDASATGNTTADAFILFQQYKCSALSDPTEVGL